MSNKAHGEDRSPSDSGSGGGGQLVSVPGQIQLPQLPSNLYTMGLEELRQFVQNHQAQWVSTSKGLVAANAAESRVQKKKGRRMALYWRNKFNKLKRESESQYNQLLQRADPYVRSKRRKKSAFRLKLSTFGGYRLALARNVGHSSAAATLLMLEADASHQASIVRWEHLLAASVLSDQRRFQEDGIDEAWLSLTFDDCGSGSAYVGVR